MSSSKEHDKKHAETDSFVEAFKSIPPIPKAKNQPQEVVMPKHQPDLPTPVDKRKNQSDPIDAAHHATLLAVEKRKNDPEQALSQLMKALNFGSKELSMNREGDMSRSQEDRFSGSNEGKLILGLIVAVSVCITGGAVISNSPWFIVFMMVVFIGVVLVIGRSEIEARHRNFKGHVVSYTGRVRKIGSEKQLQMMVINYAEETEKIFTVGLNVYNAFIDGQTYTLYLPSGWEQFILSAEHMPEDMK